MVALTQMKGFELVAESLRLDEKNRISLTKVLAKLPGLKRRCSYRVYTNQGGQIILQPMIEIPASEEWLHRNSKAIASVNRGLTQLAQGEVTDLGSFGKYVDAD